MATNNNYALELIVGVKDTFTKQSQKIEKESKKLEREFQKLQKTTADVDAFKKAEASLKELNRQGDKNTRVVKEQEQQVERLARTLHQAGVDVRNIVQEEKRLHEQVKKTNKALKEQGGSLKSIEGIAAVAGGAMASAGLMWSADDKLRNERRLAAQTGTSIEEVQSIQQRQLRTDLILKGASPEIIFETQSMAMRQGFNEKDTTDLIKSTIGLQNIYQQQSPEEIIRALSNTAKAWDVSVEEAANKLYAVNTQISDPDGEFLDVLNEYSPLLSKHLSLDQFMGAIVSGKGSGAFNADKIADSFKESFMARFSDPDEFAKLVGKGKDKGTIDAIKDKDLREQIKTAAYAVRGDIANGNLAGDNYAKLLTLVDGAKQTDALAIKPILEAIGGIPMSEDLGAKVITGIAQGLNEKRAVFEGVPTLAEASASIATPSDKAINSLNATKDSATNTLADAEGSIDGFSNALVNATAVITSITNGDALAGAGLAATLLAGSGASLYYGAKGIKNVGGKISNKVFGTNFGDTPKAPKASWWSKAGNTAKNIGRGATGIGGKLFRKVPGVGGALNLWSKLTKSSPSVVTGTANAAKNANKVAQGANAASNISKGAKGGWLSRIGGSIANGAKSLGGGLLGGVKSIGGGLLSGAKSLGGGLLGAVSTGAKGIGSALGSIGSGAWGLTKGVAKKIPLLGTLLNGASIGVSALQGDNRQVWKDVGATAGSWLGGIGGGALGALFGGAGAVPGAIGGSVGGGFAGEALGGWLYDLFGGDEEPKIKAEVVVPEAMAEMPEVQEVKVIEDKVAQMPTVKQASPQITMPEMNLSLSPVIHIESLTNEPELMAQSLVTALRDMTPQLKQALHDAMDDLYQDMDHLEYS